MNAIVERLSQSPSQNPSQGLPQVPIMSLVAMQERINRIQEVTRAKMVVDTHYGIIPGTKKFSLYKAGSEMLLVMFQIGPEVSVLDLCTPDRIKYRVTVTGIHTPTGRAVGQGVGECSSGEEKYMWRTAICAEEFAATPQERRRLKWNKSWANGQPSFYSSEQVRTAPDDLSNTILKMAKKRAQIDMTLTALGVSDLFTQDIEDLPAELQPTETEAPRRAAAVQAANSANSAGTASMTEHAGMKAAGTRQEVMKIMQSLQQAEKKQFAAYFNVRIAEFKGA